MRTPSQHPCIPPRVRSFCFAASWAAGVALALGCATNGSKVDDMSVAEHEQVASAEKAAARQHADRFDNRALRYVDLYPEAPPGCEGVKQPSCSPFWTMAKNPTERELTEAAEHAARARQHRKVAKALREAEARACAQVDEPDRDMSPFHRHRDIRHVEEMGLSTGRGPLGKPAGAAVLFAAVPGLTVESLQRIADCHLARNAALGWNQGEMSDCPLNVKGAAATVRAVGDGLVVEVTSTDAGAALEIVKRARALLGEGGPVSSAR